MSNPFTLSFGKKPAQFISRITQTNEIVENFRADVPSNQIYMLTGVRGSGKTVMMTTVSNIIAEDNNWITQSSPGSSAKSCRKIVWNSGASYAFFEGKI